MPSHKSTSKPGADAHGRGGEVWRQNYEEEEEEGAEVRKQVNAKLVTRGSYPLRNYEWLGVWHLCELSWRMGDLGRRDVDELVEGILKDRQGLQNVQLPDETIQRPSAETVMPKEEHREATRLRAEAVAALVAEEMAADPGVQTFRTDVLGGQVLKEDQLVEWLRQQRRKEVFPDLWLTNSVVPRGEGESAGVRAALQQRYDNLPRDEQGNLLPVSITVTLDPLQIWRQVDSRVLTCAVWGPEANDRDVYRCATTAGGVLERLRRLGERLAVLCTWSEEEAVRFVLTGVDPSMPRMQSSLLRTAHTVQIELKVDPAVSPKDVADYYREVRGLIINRTREASKEKLPRLVLFTVRRPRARGETWQAYMRRWNEEWGSEQPDWVYRRYETFARDCVRAREDLLNLRHIVPHWERVFPRAASATPRPAAESRGGAPNRVYNGVSTHRHGPKGHREQRIDRHLLRGSGEMEASGQGKAQQ